MFIPGAGRFLLVESEPFRLTFGGAAFDPDRLKLELFEFSFAPVEPTRAKHCRLELRRTPFPLPPSRRRLNLCITQGPLVERSRSSAHRPISITPLFDCLKAVHHCVTRHRCHHSDVCTIPSPGLDHQIFRVRSLNSLTTSGASTIKCPTYIKYCPKISPALYKKFLMPCPNSYEKPPNVQASPSPPPLRPLLQRSSQARAPPGRAPVLHHPTSGLVVLWARHQNSPHVLPTYST